MLTVIAPRGLNWRRGLCVRYVVSSVSRLYSFVSLHSDRFNRATTCGLR